MAHNGRPFGTVLVANRGEIACRILATLRRLGIRSVAVFSDADADAVHVTLADLAVRLGPAAPRGGYLDVEAVVRAAGATGADAIHPGYGFLSESADLARACEAAGVVLVGPGAAALEVMGDKIRAKQHVAAAGVPVIPGSSPAGLKDDEARAVADGLGYPLVVKPSAGGGGKGIVVVEHPGELAAALQASRRLAAAAFGDDTLLLERHLPAPRHIEVQLLADRQGTVVSLGERECSLQRRHQKVIEEAPSPLLDGPARDRLGEAACTVARSVGYTGAGTVEFLVPDGAPTEFFFLEMNPRLQVEHAVTELVTGLDLVEWQLRVAAGEPLAFTQQDVRPAGHAIEARVYAEDPSRNFLPSTGVVHVLEEPTGEGVRVDSALRSGLTIGPDYDPMLAKVIASGPDRAVAIQRLDGALSRMTVLGVRTNLAFLRGVLARDDVLAGKLDTGLLERLVLEQLHSEPASGSLSPACDPVPWVAAALWRHAHGRLSAPADDPRRRGGSWRPDGWRPGDHRPTRYAFVDADGVRAEVSVLGPARDASVAVDGGAPVPARLSRRGPDAAGLEFGGVVRAVRVAVDGPVTWVGIEGVAYELRVRSRLEHLAGDLAARSLGHRSTDPAVRAPMPGTVVSVEVTSGEDVVAGQPLLVLEAMKMEHRLVAPHDGTVTLTVRPADRVPLDHVVAIIEGSSHELRPDP